MGNSALGRVVSPGPIARKMSNPVKRGHLDASPTPKVEANAVDEPKDHAPAEKGQSGELLAFLINEVAMKELVPTGEWPTSEDAIRYLLRTITPGQLEKMHSIFSFT